MILVQMHEKKHMFFKSFRGKMVNKKHRIPRYNESMLCMLRPDYRW